MDFPWLGGPVEPASDARQAARVMREMYTALTETGFSDDQALHIVIAFVVSTSPGDRT